MDFAQPMSFDPLGSDALEMIERALHAELQRRAFSRKSEEAEALAAEVIAAYHAGVRDDLGLSIVAGLA
ncbi:hypothetical protein [Sinorhizobium fredii]|uniref:Uncharacterized protein n=1 Tax=Rhizobium fredii TaxID=380 RepID=A0A2L0HCL8_RHIFR|nr:hypothetical protein [Sinorhizobium fredii]AUX79147.1 hypothetical protein NXT3_PB00496 [Sinorhizobium fredii]